MKLPFKHFPPAAPSLGAAFFYHHSSKGENSHHKSKKKVHFFVKFEDCFYKFLYNDFEIFIE